MKHYSKERKDAVLKRMMQPESAPVPMLNRDLLIVRYKQSFVDWINEALRPQGRTLKLFKTWCDVEVHSMVLDYVDGPLLDDDLC